MNTNAKHLRSPARALVASAPRWRDWLTALGFAALASTACAQSDADLGAIEKDLNAPLYGASGKLESLDFVTLIMEVEEKINAEFGASITIADENLLSKEKSPFSSLGTLIEYLEEILKQENKLG